MSRRREDLSGSRAGAGQSHGKESFRKAEVLQQFDRLLLAEFISLVNLSAFTVVVDDLRCHSWSKKTRKAGDLSKNRYEAKERRCDERG
ncbi:hypothetical protein IEQ34_006958 [Dendrobium chrysotoxum]|uniref:Uncharacterized protein n=1 Tax=Dendrobium chrysotoxum TaxID=161865 RepID=A0AAV7H5H3_DENCH|nr:hypothetical protein IEQ34_006958 [Dendrobium chrysotoxum]